MEDSDQHIDKVTEDLHEHAHKSKEGWVMGVLLTTALLAVMAAISNNLSGHHETEGILDMITASDQWNYYQAKGIKSAVLNDRIERYKTEVHDLPVPKDLTLKAKDYEDEQQAIKDKANEEEYASRRHIKLHEIYGHAVTLFQIAIGISAISALVKKKSFWFAGLIAGFVGVIFFCLGLMF